MERNKEIEEMAKVLNSHCKEKGYLCEGKCGECMATAIYNAGYRKQSDTVKEFAEKVKDYILCGKLDIDTADSYMCQFNKHIDEIAKEMQGE